MEKFVILNRHFVFLRKKKRKGAISANGSKNVNRIPDRYCYCSIWRKEAFVHFQSAAKTNLLDKYLCVILTEVVWKLASYDSMHVWVCDAICLQTRVYTYRRALVFADNQNSFFQQTNSLIQPWRQKKKLNLQTNYR